MAERAPNKPSTGQTPVEVSPLQWVKGVGPKRAEALAAAGIVNARDLLLYTPFAYIDRGAVPSLRALRNELLNERRDNTAPEDFAPRREKMIVATIASVRDRRTARGRSFVSIVIDDGSGVGAELMFWNQGEYFRKQFSEDMLLMVAGQPELNRGSQVVFHHPELERIEAEDAELFRSGAILPKYRTSQKMKSVGMTGRQMRNLVTAVIEQALPELPETLPRDLRARFDLPSRRDALRAIHFPPDAAQLNRALHRMKFEEVFYFELFLAARKQGVKIQERAPACKKRGTRARELVEALPFDLTRAQKRVVREIVADMRNSTPMNRLLQGDVGSGKTIVALLAMLVAADNGLQSVMMAPTEILAEQHFHSLQAYLEGHGLRVVQLVGGMRAKMRRELLETIALGNADIIVGTHALFEPTVHYNKLGLVVIDEQHRFGVMQRAKLKERAHESHAATAGGVDVSPHILVMSATPIPRTLSMTLYGDLDVSIIDELPRNRKPINTRVVFESQLDEVFDFVREQVQAGKQAYIVYPLVEKSEKLELKSAEEHHEFLSQTVFPDMKVGMLHGRMLWYEKEDTMRDFKERKYHILVATTVVEVGIDVPNATVMIIENAERFGLSQLHQLRGRVGRGADQSYCLLATKDHFRFHMKKSAGEEDERKAAIIRLRTMEETTDGFKIAEVDMKLRGPGDMLGTKQSGLPEFNFVDLIADTDVIAQARQEAFALVDRDPHLADEENAVVRARYKALYNKEYGFMDIA